LIQKRADLERRLLNPGSEVSLILWCRIDSRFNVKLQNKRFLSTKSGQSGRQTALQNSFSTGNGDFIGCADADCLPRPQCLSPTFHSLHATLAAVSGRELPHDLTPSLRYVPVAESWRQAGR